MKVILPGMSLTYLENLSIIVSRVLFLVLNMRKAIMKSSMIVVKGMSSAVIGYSLL